MRGRAILATLVVLLAAAQPGPLRAQDQPATQPVTRSPVLVQTQTDTEFPLATPVPAQAQATEPAPLDVLPGGFLVIDQDALFSRSAFGKRILAETDAATKTLMAENRGIEAQLVAEEKDLTERRPKMKPEDFRTLADAWDQKVQGIREEQTHKGDEIGKSLETHRREFFQAIVPVLAGILRETHAVAILDKRTVLISANVIDATDLAVSRIDEKLGDGQQAQKAVEDQGNGQAGTETQAPAPDEGKAPDAILDAPAGQPAGDGTAPAN